MNKQFIIILLVNLTTFAFSQPFQRQAEMPKVGKDGFYSVVLGPEITSYVKSDLSDIRLYGDKEEIPYIIRQETPRSEKYLFREYKILENVAENGCCTRLILENTGRSKINNISLIIRNADVRKKARLSGSDDLQNWYVIKDRYQLEGIHSNHQTYEARVLDFPLSNYIYYRLEIEDSLSAPLQILTAGYYDTYDELGKYASVKSSKIIQTDSSDRNTYLWISYDAPQIIEKIRFSIDHPPFFHREAKICKIRYDKRNRIHLQPIQHFSLRSNQDKEVQTNFHAREFCIVISNKDNPPLKINEFEAFQLVRYLTAYLKAGQEYLLLFGSEKTRRPEYDLMFYNDSIPANVPLIQVVGFSQITPESVVEEQKSFFGTTLWIWTAIVMIVMVLGYMSWKMVGEMKKPTNQ